MTTKINKINTPLRRLMNAEHELISRRAKLLYGTLKRTEIDECKNCHKLTVEPYCESCTKTLDGREESKDLHKGRL